MAPLAAPCNVVGSFSDGKAAKWPKNCGCPRTTYCCSGNCCGSGFLSASVLVDSRDGLSADSIFSGLPLLGAEAAPPANELKMIIINKEIYIFFKLVKNSLPDSIKIFR